MHILSQKVFHIAVMPHQEPGLFMLLAGNVLHESVKSNVARSAVFTIFQFCNTMKLLIITEENIENEHICCAISDKKSREGYQKKKDWLKSEFKHGYRFQKLDVRGKVFIEYVPIENSWLPLQGNNFMVINCFWVSGKFKSKGNGKQLLQQCLKDAGKMDGVVAISSDKKRPFMSDPKFLKHQGFKIIDEAAPFFKLWGIKTNPEAIFPTIMESAKSGTCPDKKGITAYYSNSCPFTDYYTNQLLR